MITITNCILVNGYLVQENREDISFSELSTYIKERVEIHVEAYKQKSTLKISTTTEDYCGFTLQEGFLQFALNQTTMLSSGWECNNHLYCYTHNGYEWCGEWYPLDDLPYDVHAYVEDQKED